MVQEIWRSTDKVWYANLAMPGFFQTWWDTFVHPMDLWKAVVEINLRGFLLVNGRLMTGVPLAITLDSGDPFVACDSPVPRCAQRQETLC